MRGGATSSTPVQCKLPLVGVCLTSVSLSDRASPSPSANAIHRGEQQGARGGSARWLNSRGKRHLWTNCTRRSSPSVVAFPAMRRGVGAAQVKRSRAQRRHTSSNDVVAPLILKETDTGKMRDSMSLAFT